ncbi:cold-shock protein [Wenyingzhuangia aestuarii]|uniref:cold-shock protein n=1 Tax=Wenyingzhuangia aestuarii TaxID=1647582 RepID=UPI00143AE386|nr:cold shock domain-containing protein [Wenyingzhuangia aestuarii]NJB82044.1 cold shock CspA family protein [Wenyingzhuangia aestuarii]
MAESFEKKEREKKKAKKRREKALRKEQLKESGEKTAEFMYMGADGQLTTEKPDPTIVREEVSLSDIHISTPKKEDLEQEDPVKIGIVKNFNNDKGYGFIDQKDTGDSLFVHINNIEGTIKEGNKVSFEIERGAKGLVAVKVKLYVA